MTFTKEKISLNANEILIKQLEKYNNLLKKHNSTIDDNEKLKVQNI